MSSVSVIIPVFNVEPYIGRCVRSLFAQTLQDIEFIFIDDCTPDHSMGVMQEVLADFPNRKEQVRCYRMPQNSGQAKVRMQGISMAAGEYVIHCDSDDMVAIDAYEKMYLLAKKEDADIVICNMQRGNDSDWKQFECGSETGKEVSDILTGKVMGSLCNRLVRRPLLEDLIPPVGNMAEDMVLALQATCRAQKIVHLNEALYYYYWRPDSISVKPGKEASVARYASLFGNIRACVGFLKSLYGYDVMSSDIVAFKYRSRHYLEPYVHYSDVYHKWRSSFPEVDKVLLFTRGITLDTKFWFLLIHLHLYHPWKVMTGRAKEYDT